MLLKVADEAGGKVTLYGQEKDAATSNLARMNMILHNYPTAEIKGAGKSSIADPAFMDGDKLKQFDYVVANPPFSDKRWSTGLDPLHDPHERFTGFGVPPAKQGDYAFLLHIVRSLKSTGRGACILPHGVLFRDNAEAKIRRNLIEHRYIKGIIGLPANLFYGTGIPACIIVIDKEGDKDREGIFMIDASDGFMKEGPKNRLRSQDIHKIVDVFNKQIETPKYARLVPFAEIEKNEFNLNLPRYIDSQKKEDLQDISGHLQGGIPVTDIEALEQYWQVYPSLKSSLFEELRPCFFSLKVEKTNIKSTIFEHDEFKSFVSEMSEHFEAWKQKAVKKLKALKVGNHPRELIWELSEDILHHYEGKALINAYDIYQYLMDYWAAIMQDDCYIISADGWKAETYRIIEKDKKGKEKDKGWTCDLVPKDLIVAKYFSKEQAELDELSTNLESITAELSELEEEHSGDEGVFAELEKVNKTNVNSRLKEIKGNDAVKDKASVLSNWIGFNIKQSELRRKIKEAEANLDEKAFKYYEELKEADIKLLVIEDKWLATIEADVQGEIDRVSQALAARVKELAERYESPLPKVNARLSEFEAKVNQHLEKMGYLWQ